MDEEFSFKNEHTYKEKRDFTLISVHDHYRHVILEYMTYVLKNQTKYAIHNSNTISYIIIRGLETITHVFMMTILHTNNIDAALYYAQKSIIIYTEFITQITHGKNAVFDLNSRDAVVYVYKKTIFMLKRRSVENNVYAEMDAEAFPMVNNMKTGTSKYVVDNIKNVPITEQHIEGLIDNLHHIRLNDAQMLCV
jgi:hypothetical protein